MVAIASRSLLLLLALAAVLCAGCGSHSNAKRETSVCRNLHENARLMDAVMLGKPTMAVANPTPVTAVTSKLGDPDHKLLTRDRLNYWFVYGNTAYFIVASNAPYPTGYYVAGKACDWSYTRDKLNRVSSGISTAP